MIDINSNDLWKYYFAEESVIDLVFKDQSDINRYLSKLDISIVITDYPGLLYYKVVTSDGSWCFSISENIQIINNKDIPEDVEKIRQNFLKEVGVDRLKQEIINYYRFYNKEIKYE